MSSKYKKNPYVLFLRISDEEYILWDTLNRNRYRVNRETKDAIENNIEKLPSQTINELSKNDVIISNNISPKKLLQQLETDIKPDKEYAGLGIILSHECNLGCTYCLNNKRDSDPKERMKEKNIENIFKLVDGNNLPTKKCEDLLFELTGGEPLLPKNKDLVLTLFKKLEERGISIIINSNGTNINDYIDIILEYETLIGNITIPIDGPRKVHNKRRPYKSGGGTYDDIISGISSLINRGFDNISTSMMIDESNIEHLPEHLEILYNKGILEKTGVTTAIPSSYGCWSVDRAREVKRRGKIMKKGIDILNEMDQISKFKEYLKFDNGLGCSFILEQVLKTNVKMPEIKTTHCPAFQRRGLSFLPDGYIYPCLQCESLERLQIGKYNPKIELYYENMEMLKDRNISNLSQCWDCSLLLICAGGCPFRDMDKDELKDMKSGNISHIGTTTCITSKELFEEHLPTFLNDNFI